MRVEGTGLVPGIHSYNIQECSLLMSSPLLTQQRRVSLTITTLYRSLKALSLRDLKMVLSSPWMFLYTIKQGHLSMILRSSFRNSSTFMIDMVSPSHHGTQSLIKLLLLLLIMLVKSSKLSISSEQETTLSRL